MVYVACLSLSKRPISPEENMAIFEAVVSRAALFGLKVCTGGAATSANGSTHLPSLLVSCYVQLQEDPQLSQKYGTNNPLEVSNPKIVDVLIRMAGVCICFCDSFRKYSSQIMHC